MNYRISDNTLAIVPCGKTMSQIIEKDDLYVVHKSTIKVIERSCEHFGVKYETRIKNSEKIVKTRYKVPIIVEEEQRLVFFPINSTKKNGTLWINFSNILEYYKKGRSKKCTVVKFKNGYMMDIDISYYSFNNQYLKAANLCAILSLI